MNTNKHICRTFILVASLSFFVGRASVVATVHAQDSIAQSVAKMSSFIDSITADVERLVQLNNEAMGGWNACRTGQDESGYEVRYNKLRDQVVAKANEVLKAKGATKP